MEPIQRKKILFYSHDTMGLGHIRRTQKIANELAGLDVAILVICSSPKAMEFRSEPGIEFLKLPGFTKLKSGQYTPRNLNVSLEDFVALRAQIILSAVASFSPDVFVVDKEPLGVKGELKPTLEYLQKQSPRTHTICGIRDILDKPELIKKEWERRGSEQALIDYYDSIIVYGDPSIYDFQKEYGFSDKLTDRIHYMGYILQTEKQNLQSGWQNQFSKPSSKPLVTFSLGGGEDGDEFLSVFVSLLEKYKKEVDFDSLIVTGPFLSNGRLDSLNQRVSPLENVQLIQFFPNMYGVLKKSDVIVAMGGYNTFSECLALKKKPIILPRIVPREEQLIRAQIFASKGLCDYIHPTELTEERLLAKIREQLQGVVRSDECYDGNGLAKTAQFIKDRAHEAQVNLKIVP